MMLLWRTSMEQIEYSSLKKLDSSYGTPFYLMDSNIYENNIKNFLSSLTQYYKKIIIGYSFKTNYTPALCQKALTLGCFAEVVSAMEFDLALKAGFSKIIFNGPIKSYDYLAKAFELDAIINIDSAYEIDYVLEYRKRHLNKKLKVGLRVNVELKDSDGNSVIQSGLKSGRFGFSQKLLPEIVETLRSNDIIINSIHGHTSSSDRAAINYTTIVNYMLNVCKQLSLTDIEFFDVGGGFFGAAANGIDISNKPTYDEYSKSIFDCLLNDDWFGSVNPYVVIEPGASVVSNVFSYVSKVYQVKTMNDKVFVVTDGTVFDVKPTMHKNNLPFKLYSKTKSPERILCDFVGSTCMEKDVILSEIKMQKPQFGDYVVIDGVGSYTISLTPTFINYLSPIIDISDNNIKIVRRRQTLEDITRLYTY